MNEELNDLTVDELQERARDADITGRSSMNKGELVDALSSQQQGTQEPQEPQEPQQQDPGVQPGEGNPPSPAQPPGSPDTPDTVVGQPDPSVPSETGLPGSVGEGTTVSNEGGAA